jgi:hypothetical protein
MKKDVIICIGTIGSPTFDKSYSIAKSIKKRYKNVKKIEVIEGYSPQCSWLNEMIVRSQGYTWCLQLDEDMYLKENAIKVLLNKARERESEGVGVGVIHGMLWDIFLEQQIGSLKLWRTKILKKFQFEDILGSDRKVVTGIKKKGYQTVSISDILGDHDSAPTVEIGQKKYFEYVQKIRKFNGEDKALAFIESLKKKNKDESIIKYAQKGLSNEIINKSKKVF